MLLTMGFNIVGDGLLEYLFTTIAINLLKVLVFLLIVLVFIFHCNDDCLYLIIVIINLLQL